MLKTPYSAAPTAFSVLIGAGEIAVAFPCAIGATLGWFTAPRVVQAATEPLRAAGAFDTVNTS